VHCWSHLRRRFVKLARNSKSPIAEAAVRHIAQLYAIEAMVRGSSPDMRLAARREHSLAMVTALKPWFEKQLSMISNGSTLAEDIRYALNHWQGLTRFLEDGRLELDTKPVENAIRPVCLTRKNALFAGHEVGAENWALLASIVATCKLNDVNPAASSTAIPIAESKTSCRGDSAKRQACVNRVAAKRLHLPKGLVKSHRCSEQHLASYPATTTWQGDLAFRRSAIWFRHCSLLTKGFAIVRRPGAR
jgi:hypothetical protein